MRPSTPPAVMTSSPFCSASTICFWSLARFICGRIMRKYSSTNIRMIGRKPMNPGSPPKADWAKAGEMITAALRKGNAKLYQPLALLQKGCRGPGERSLLDRRAQLRHELLVVVQVVKRVEACAENLVRLLQMVKVGACEAPAGVAGAALIQGRGVVAVACVADLDVAEAREQPAVARVARRQHAVEHVDACADRLDDVLGCAHAHQIAGFLGRHPRHHVADDSCALLLGCAYGQSADGVP